MIMLYEPDDTSYSRGGLNISKFCTKAECKEILNGTFTLELELYYDKRIWSKIQREKQIQVTTHRGILTFRIVDITTSIDRLKIRCRHILWDLASNLIEDIYCKEMDGNQALAHILNGGNYAVKWTASSDITVKKNCRIVREYMLDALMGNLDNSFRNRWGGELTANDYSFTINKRRGKEEAHEIKYRKDLVGFEYFEDVSELATRVLPMGFDGMMLPEKYVDSPIIKDYNQIHIRKVKYEDIKVKQNDEDEGYTSVEECYQVMRERVQQLFELGEIDKPKQNFRANMAILRDSIQYRNYNINKLEYIQLGDTVNVNIVEYNIIATKRCISISYDCLSERYIEVELGDFKTYEQIQSFATNEVDISDQLESLKSGMFFVQNNSVLTVGSDFMNIANINFASVASTHLNLAITIVGTAAAEGVLNMQLFLNNEQLPMEPGQLVHQGKFTWTITCPLLFIKPNIPNLLNIKINSTTTVTIAKENFVATVYGQSVGGASAEFPHIEYIEFIEKLGFTTVVIDDIQEPFNHDALITFYNPIIIPYEELVDKLSFDNLELQDKPNISIELRLLKFRAYWKTHTNYIDYYNIDTTKYDIDTNGIKPKLINHTLSKEELGSIELNGFTFTIDEYSLPNRDEWIIFNAEEE